MAVTIKSKREISLMRQAGRILNSVLEELGKTLQPGMNTKQIDQLGETLIRSYGCVPSFLGFEGYPASLCVSINEEVVHGIPNPNRVLHDGDVVSLDAGLIFQGYQADAARTYGIGEISEEARDLIRVTEESFFEGIKYARDGGHLYDISAAVGNYCESRGYGVVRDLTGHGIGTSMHEDPEIPNFEMDRKGMKLKAGMTLCIEPMITTGTWEVEWMDDGWTCCTKDNSLAAHYENTVLITEGDPEILTLDAM